MSKKRNWLALITACTFITVLVIGIVYAISIFIAEDHNLSSSTNYYRFVVKNSDENYDPGIDEGADDEREVANLHITKTSNYEIEVKNIGTNTDDIGTYQVLIFPQSSSIDEYTLTVNGDQLDKYQFEYSATVINPYVSNSYIYTPSSNLNAQDSDVFTVQITPDDITVTDFTVDLKLAVIRYSKHNSFISHIYDLEHINNEYHRIVELENDLDFYENQPILSLNEKNQAVYLPEFKYLYFMNDLEINKDLLINVPASVNFLFANITLSENTSLTYEHSYGGMFYLKSFGGKVNNDNLGSNFTINTKFAYYQGVDNELVTDTDNFYKYAGYELDWRDLHADYNTALLSDAKKFIDNYIPSRLYDDLILPTSYHLYDVAYTYTIPGAVSSQVKSFPYSDNKVKHRVNRIENSVTYTLTTRITSGSFINTTKNLTIIGTGKDALASAYAAELSEYIATNSRILNKANDDQNYFSSAIDLVTFTKQFIRNAKIAETFTVELPTETQLELILNGAVVATNKITFTYDNGYALLEGGANRIVLQKRTIVAKTKLEDIKVTVSDGTPATAEALVFGLTIAERNELLDRYSDLLYLSDKTELPVLVKDPITGKIYLGDQLVVDANLLLSELNHYFLEISSTAYDNYLEGNITFEDLLALGGGISDIRMTLEDGFVSPNKSFKLRDGFIFIHAIKGSYTDSAEGYLNVTKVIIPPDGIGGSEYEEFLRGDTFAEYFAGLEDQMLIEDKDYDGFTTDRAQLWVRMYILSVDNVDLPDRSTEVRNENGDLYCWIESYYDVGNAIQREYIRIDVENIPAKNTEITVVAVFTLDYQDELEFQEEKRISVQNYNFIIPGIYRYGAHIDDIFIYNRMLEIYGHFQGYLLIKDAIVSKELFDASFSIIDDVNVQYLFDYGRISEATLSNQIIVEDDGNGNKYIRADVGYVYNLRGIELLTKTKEMRFNDLNVNDLIMFCAYDNAILERLELRNCNITDSKIYAGGQFPLYHLIRLTYIDLSNNDITSLYFSQKWIFRTVENLDLSNQEQLADIEHISTALPFINYLDISDNEIKSFIPLKQFTYLKKVWLYKNIVLDGHGLNSTHYGTHGEVNIPVYVHLYDFEVEVCVAIRGGLEVNFLIIKDINKTDGSPEYIAADRVTNIDGYMISNDTYLAALAMNSIYFFSEYWLENAGYIVFPKLLEIYSKDYSLTYNVDITFLSIDGIEITNIGDYYYTTDPLNPYIEVEDLLYFLSVNTGKIDMIINIEDVYGLYSFVVY